MRAAFVWALAACSGICGCRVVLGIDDKVYVARDGGSHAGGGAAGGEGGEGPAICGDGVKQSTEPCDGADVGDATCASLLGGDDPTPVRCTELCTYDVGGCERDTPILASQEGMPWPMHGHDRMHTGRNMAVVGPQTNALAWSDAYDVTATYHDPAYGTPIVTGDDLVIVPDRGYPEGWLRAFHLDGSVAWNAQVGPNNGIFGTPAVVDRGGNIELWAAQQLHFDPPGGIVRFSYTDHSATRKETVTDHFSFDAGPVFDAAGNFYDVDTMGSVYGYAPDGSLAWGVVTGQADGPSPAVGPDGTVFAASGLLVDSTATLTAISPQGDRLWSFVAEEPGCLTHTTPMVSLEGTVYLVLVDGCTNYEVIAFHSDGSQAWRTTLPIYAGYHGALGPDGMIYLPTSDGLIALRPDGSIAWTWDEAPGAVWALTLTRGSGDSPGTIYMGGQTFIAAVRLRATEAPEPLWTYTDDGLAAYGCISQPSVGADGTLYVSCNDGSLYAFRDP